MQPQSPLGVAPIGRDYELLHGSAIRVDPGPHSLVELSGEDWRTWLQGQITNDVRLFKPGERFSFCMCTPTGQIEAIADAWLDQDHLLVVLPTQAAGAFLDRVEQMTILEDVHARNLTGLVSLTSVQGPGSSTHVCAGIALPSNRLQFGGLDIWAASDVAAELPLMDAGAYESARIEAGQPKFGIDILPRTLPPEMGEAFMERYVSLTKGCYTGQEVLMRIDTKGHTNRTWVGLLADWPIISGAQVKHESREDAGVVTSVALSPVNGPIGAALVRGDVARAGERVTVGTPDGDVRAVVVELPFPRPARR